MNFIILVLVALGIIVVGNLILSRKKKDEVITEESNIIEIAQKVKPVVEDEIRLAVPVKSKKPRVKKSATVAKSKVKKDKKIVNKKKK
jgi:hypothetical protein